VSMSTVHLIILNLFLLGSERKQHELFSRLVRLCGPILMDRLFADHRTNEDIIFAADSVSCPCPCFVPFTSDK
jgi:hypothetical protein